MTLSGLALGFNQAFSYKLPTLGFNLIKTMAFIKREISVVAVFSNDSEIKETDIPDILAWYKERFQNIIGDFDVKDLDIIHQGGSEFKIVYEHSEAEDAYVLDEIIADPDDDGNYPIREGILLAGYVKHSS